MGRHSTSTTLSAVLTPPPSPSKKRKRGNAIFISELEVDVLAPEPPSKKAQRKAKKDKTTVLPETQAGNEESTDSSASHQHVLPSVKLSKTSERSEYGIWIGNLPWTATITDLQRFLSQNNESIERSVTRIHMPLPSKAILTASQQRVKPQNKGFAYVDFSTQEALDSALALSEKLVSGRRVLIKDAKSFEGRPEPGKEDGLSSSIHAGKEPSTRIFVGNLGFDVTRDNLVEHFEQCGEVADVHIATFEDSGKCKGYAWIHFTELQAAKYAVRGWINFEHRRETRPEEDANVVAADTKTIPKFRKWWINRLHDRPLRMEFAEDKAVRYKKRFGKSILNDYANPAGPSLDGEIVSAKSNDLSVVSVQTSQKHQRPHPSNPTKNIDARQIKPGAALAAAPRSIGAIVEGKGRKIVFD